ncbi:hypothetical protein A3J41_01050 [candidate division TM6 bacterium RIFCSPHIGHO2_12_FULL_38_8]|nr:MAG: hypothetical protein A3J41_01050 [candidate division TM6 bacterium RIFCSPHIGHO2_12_FULL_38_8]
MEIYPEFFTYFTSAGTESVLTLYLNPTFGTAPVYSSVNSATSVVDYSTTASVITGGTPLFTFFEVGGLAFSINLFDQAVILEPGDVLVIAARTLSGMNTAYASLSWSERF